MLTHLSKVISIPGQALLMLLVHTSFDKAHDFYSRIHASVYFASLNLADFPLRIKLSTKKDQKVAISFFKNLMTFKILKRAKQK